VIPFWLSLAALAVAPVLYLAAGRRSSWVRWLDMFVLATLAILIVFVIMPDLVRHAGLWAIAMAVVGFVGPGLIEWRSHRIGHQAHLFALVVAVLGLVAHAIVDGVALSAGGASFHPEAGHAHGFASEHAHGAGMSSLGWAVILHRLPVGFAVWSLLSANYGRTMAALGLALIAGGTWLGWSAGGDALSKLSSTGIHLFEAFVAGSLLHVFVHRPHDHAHDR
jgi:lipoprotein signal peptidase